MKKPIASTYRRVGASAKLAVSNNSVETEKAMLRRIANLAKSKQTKPAIAR